MGERQRAHTHAARPPKIRTNFKLFLTRLHVPTFDKTAPPRSDRLTRSLKKRGLSRKRMETTAYSNKATGQTETGVEVSPDQKGVSWGASGLWSPGNVAIYGRKRDDGGKATKTSKANFKHTDSGDHSDRDFREMFRGHGTSAAPTRLQLLPALND